MAWVKACRVDDLRNCEGLRVQLRGGGKKDAVALFKYGGEFFALEDRCCHADKSIHGGDIEDLGECVIGKSGEIGKGGICVQCPRHQKKFAGGLYFNLKTGYARTPEYTKKFRKMDQHFVKVHDVKVEEGRVYVSSAARKVQSSSSSSSSDSDDAIQIDDDAAPPAPLGKGRSLQGDDNATEKKLKREDSSMDFCSCRLSGKEVVNHDTFVFHLDYPRSVTLPPAPASPVWHVTLRAHVNGTPVERDYTPLSTWSEWHDEHRLRLLIKIYPDGVMTQYLHGLPVDADVLVSDPCVTLTLPALLPPARSLLSRKVPHHALLFAAGTGIMPMLQVLGHALETGSDWLTVTLLYSNQTRADVLCLDDLVTFARRGQSKADNLPSSFQKSLQTRPLFKIWLAITQDEVRNSSSWCNDTQQHPCIAPIVEHRFDGKVISRAISHLPDETVLVLSSGPDGFFEAMSGALPSSVRQEGIFVNLED